MALAKEEFARRVRAARVRTGKSQSDIAEAVGGSLRQVQRWESAEFLPHPRYVPRLAEAIGVPVEHLEEPKQETVLERVERKADENAALLRSVLGLLDSLRADVLANREAVASATAQVTGRLDVIEARADATDTQLSEIQAEFLRALGAPAPSRVSSEPGQASSTQPTTIPGSGS